MDIVLHFELFHVKLIKDIIVLAIYKALLHSVTRRSPLVKQNRINNITVEYEDWILI